LGTPHSRVERELRPAKVIGPAEVVLLELALIPDRLLERQVLLAIPVWANRLRQIASG